MDSLYNEYINRLSVNVAPDATFDNIVDSYVEQYGITVFLDYADLDQADTY